MLTRLGQYELLEKFAEGGMAEVWFGRVVGAEGFLREVAVKRLLPPSVRDPDQVAMFLDEARLGATLHHPHIVSVLDLGGGGASGAVAAPVAGAGAGGDVDRDDAWFLVMELVDGPHLGRLFAHSLRLGKPLPLPFCAAIVAAAAEGLHHAHERVDPVTGQSLDIVHRDVSPQNVLISRYGDVKVTDFGVARARSHRSRTRSGVVKGKLGYLSPEQCRGQPVDRRSDVFSLGIVLYELLTRRRLFRGDGEFDVMQRICEQETPPPGLVTEDVDATLGEIALRALRKEPAARFQSAGELGDALWAWLQAQGVGDWRHQLGWWVRNHTAPIWMPLEQRMLRWAERDALQGRPVVIDRTRTDVAMQRLPRALPPEPDVFVGRRAELEVIGERLAAGARWITLRGVPGVGKSRLGQRALRLRADAGAAALRVDVDSCDSEAALVAQLLDALGLPAEAEAARGAAVVEHALARAGEAFLLLDGADAARTPLARLLPRWLERAPAVRVIVTARRPLRGAGEHIIEVGPLALPAEGLAADEALAGSEAVALLLARAREVRPGFRVVPGQAAAIAELVRRLDGLPLALELAAARLEVLEPDALLQRLLESSDALRGGGRHGDTGLRDVFAAALCDLPPQQLRLLARATVLHGPFDIATAEQVLAADDGERRDLIPTLDALRERSLLRLRDEGAGAPRHVLLGSLRAIAADALDAADGAATRARRDAWLVKTATALVERLERLGGADARRRLLLLREELDAAVALPTAPPEVVLAWALVRGRHGPIDGVAERVAACLGDLGAASPLPVAAELALAWAEVEAARGDLAAARRALDRAAAAEAHAPRALARLSAVALRQDRPAEALAAADRGLSLLRAKPMLRGGGELLLARARALDALGRRFEAATALELAVAALRGEGQPARLAWALAAAADRALDAGDAESAGPLALEAIEAAERGGDARAGLRGRLAIAAAALLAGRLGDARASLERGREEPIAAIDAELAADLAWLGVAADLAEGRSAQRAATLAFEAASRTSDRRRLMRAALARCAAALADGDGPAAEQALDAAEGWVAGKPEERAWIAALAARLPGSAAPGAAPAPPPPAPPEEGMDLGARLLRGWIAGLRSPIS